jgi:hypothetical protein
MGVIGCGTLIRFSFEMISRRQGGGDAGVPSKYAEEHPDEADDERARLRNG